ncbi:MAG: pilin [Patescibacteria group bacterium]|nr:pilin [Patescibacteria group bacterium]
MKLNIKKSAFLIVPMLLLAGTVFAAPPQNIGEVASLMWSITNWIFTFFLIFAVIYIIVAAFMYLTAGGDPEKIKNAKMQLLYAIIAIVIASLSKLIVYSVSDISGATPSGSSTVNSTQPSNNGSNSSQEPPIVNFNQ